ncbi:hypothetical protein [Pseudomonas aeruginosa]|uniref:hypothetical protein n=1 Tax=Pseudomonas aeruginosa TaxID=287 RepID=UPI0022EC0ABA|nr:hypothetical protein [Pseudomonas aeruginosa]
MNALSNRQIPVPAAFVAPNVLTEVGVADWVYSHQVIDVLPAGLFRHYDRKVFHRRFAGRLEQFALTLLVYGRLDPLKNGLAFFVERRRALQHVPVRNSMVQVMRRTPAFAHKSRSPTLDLPLADVEVLRRLGVRHALQDFDEIIITETVSGHQAFSCAAILSSTNFA